MRNKWKLNMALAALALLLLPSLGMGAEALLVAVASEGKEATSLVSDFAGRSRYYLLFSGTDFVQALQNPFLDKGPGAGPDVVDYLARKGVGLLIAGRFGPFLVEAMNKKGMKYMLFSGVAQKAAEQAPNFLRPPTPLP
jgi:predicted Fe-Mo cluster-binding NifX family protein